MKKLKYFVTKNMFDCFNFSQDISREKKAPTDSRKAELRPRSLASALNWIKLQKKREAQKSPSINNLPRHHNPLTLISNVSISIRK